MQSLISVDEATHAVHAQARVRAIESVPLAEAVGRVLAHEIMAERAHPPFDRVTMDGVATRWLPVMPALLRVAGAQTAGGYGQTLREADTCIEVAGGALLPEGCDCVIPIEHLVRSAQGRRPTACPQPPAPVAGSSFTDKVRTALPMPWCWMRARALARPRWPCWRPTAWPR